MALTLTEKFRGPFCGKMVASYRVVHDGSTLTLTAASMGMHMIEAIMGNNTYTSMQAPASTFLKMQSVSIGTGGAYIGWDGSDANGKTDITVLGW